MALFNKKRFSLGGATEKCWVCGKSIYPNDPQINFNGKIHKGCARCTDCSTTLNVQNMFTIKDGDKMIPLCGVHNVARAKAYKSAVPTTQQSVSIMSAAMERALAATPKHRSITFAPSAEYEPDVTSGADVRKTADGINSKIGDGGDDGGDDDEQAPESTTSGVSRPHTLRFTEDSLGKLVDDLGSADEDTQLRTIWEISNLAKEEEATELFDPKIGLLSRMANILDSSDSFDSKAAAAGVLWSLSVNSENRPIMADKEINLLSSLAIAATASHYDTSHRALGTLHNISLSEATQASFREVTVVHDQLSDAINSEDDRLSDQAMGVLWNLSQDRENRNIFTQNSSLLEGVVRSLKRSRADATDIAGKGLVVIYYLTLNAENRAVVGAVPQLFPNMLSLMENDPELVGKSCGILVNLSLANENKERMCSPESGLLAYLVKLLSAEERSADVCGKITACFWNLSVLGSNRPMMSKPELGLVAVLVQILSEIDKVEMNESMTKSCVAIQNLAGAKECHKDLLAAGGRALYEVLIKQVLAGQAETRPRAFGALVNLSLSAECQLVFGNTEGAFRALMLTVADGESVEMRSRACAVLHNLSVNESFRVNIANEPGMLGNLIKLIEEPGPLRKNAIGLVLNLCISAENKPVIARADGLVAAAMKCMKADADTDAQERCVSIIWSLCGDKDTRHFLSENTALIDSLTVAAGRGGELSKKAMGALSNLAPKIKIKDVPKS